MDMLDEAVNELEEINKRLRDGFLFYSTHVGVNDSAKFFKNVMHFGFNPSEIIVLSLTPDGDDTVIGRFMVVDRSIYSFDFDLVDCNYSVLKKITDHATEGGRGLEYAEALEEAAANALFDRRI